MWTVRKLSHIYGLVLVQQTSKSLLCTGSQAAFWAQSRLEPSPGLWAQVFTPLCYCSTQSVAPLCAEPGLPKQAGQGTRPAPWLRTGGTLGIHRRFVSQ